MLDIGRARRSEPEVVDEAGLLILGVGTDLRKTAVDIGRQGVVESNSGAIWFGVALLYPDREAVRVEKRLTNEAE